MTNLYIMLAWTTLIKLDIICQGAKSSQHAKACYFIFTSFKKPFGTHSRYQAHPFWIYVSIFTVLTLELYSYIVWKSSVVF
jgi:hypothetical protein